MISLCSYSFVFIVYFLQIAVAMNPFWRRDNCPPVPVINDIHPYGLNLARVNPDYCVGFKITHPVDKGLIYDRGSLQKISWKVDPSKMDDLPTNIYRIRLLDSTQYNQAVLGENMTIFSMGNYTGEATFPMEVYNVESEYHYRIMVTYPNQSVNCIFESVPFVIKPSSLGRFTGVGEAPPSYAKVPGWIT